MTDARLPDPAVVVLAGAAGSGKSTWAAARFRTAEIVSSDALRAAVGSGPADLDASVEAFAMLDQIIAARTKRSLTTVIDTLGLDPVRRADYLRLARAAGLPAVLVIMNTAARLCRDATGNATARSRRRSSPNSCARSASSSIRRRTRAGTTSSIIDQEDAADPAVDEPTIDHDHSPSALPHVVLQVSRFPWGEADPGGWLRDLALTADAIGFHGIALMDHLIQIPQVDRAWEPIPEP